MFRDISPDADGRESNATCRINSTECPLSMTANFVDEFARNNTAFMEAFGPAFEKLLSTGYRENELLIAKQVGPEVSPSPTPIEPSSSPTPADAGATLQSVLLLTITLLMLAMLA